MSRSVILLSGGMDSATVLAMAKRHGAECFALSFDYGQRHACELDAACRVVEALKMAEHKTVKLDLRAFGGSALTDDISVPNSYVDVDQIDAGVPAFKLFHMAGLANSGGAARRLIEQGGAYINGNRLNSYDYLVTKNDVENMEMLLRAGKKRFHKIIIKK